MRASCVFVPLFFAMAVPAVAQRRTTFEPGTKILAPAPASVPSRSLDKYDRNRVVMNRFAQCTLDRFPAKTYATLRMSIGPRYYDALSKLASSDCLAQGQLRFASSLLRGALFAELWRRRNAAEAKSASWGPRLPPFDPVEVSAATQDYQAQQHAALIAFANCVIAHDRIAASDVLTTEVGSKAQDVAYRRLQASLGPCLNKGVSLKFSKPMLEGVLAEALYRSPVVGAIGSTSSVSGNN